MENSDIDKAHEALKALPIAVVDSTESNRFVAHLNPSRSPAPADQQEEEKRRSAAGGDHPHRKLYWCQDSPGHRITDQEEPGSHHRTYRYQPAMVSADDQSYTVRHHQADETDQTGTGDCHSGYQGSAEKAPPFHPLHFDPKLRRGLLTKGQGVEVPALTEQVAAARSD